MLRIALGKDMRDVTVKRFLSQTNEKHHIHTQRIFGDESAKSQQFSITDTKQITCIVAHLFRPSMMVQRSATGDGWIGRRIVYRPLETTCVFL